MDVGRPNGATQLRPLETGRLGERAKEALLDAIRDGGFPDGALPSEERLAQQLGVSRTTVREALRSLEELGVITRHRGVGTRVNEHVLRVTALNRAAGFVELIREAGAVPAIAWTRVRREPAAEDVAYRLDLETGRDVLLIERLLLGDGRPLLHLVEHVSREELTREVAADDVPDSIFDFGDRYCRVPIDHTIVEISPVLADATVAAHLDADAGAPLLRLLETHFAADGRPLAFSVIHTLDRLLRLSVVRKRM
jgi:GntR family transcriptional regulator